MLAWFRLADRYTPDSASNAQEPSVLPRRAYRRAPDREPPYVPKRGVIAVVLGQSTLPSRKMAEALKAEGMRRSIVFVMGATFIEMQPEGTPASDDGSELLPSVALLEVTDQRIHSHHPQRTKNICPNCK